ncbi:hypothetical protein WDW86_00060 [Bdellovibrionota bacterium FG-2]
MGKILLSITAQPRTRDFVTAIATAVGMKPVIVSTANDAVEHLKHEEVGSFFAELKNEAELHAFEAVVQGSVGLFSELINPNFTHFICPLELEAAPFLLQSPLFGHYLSQGSQAALSEQDAELYSKVVSGTLSQKKGLGTKDLLNQGAQLQVVRLESAGQRLDLIQAIRSYLLAAQFSTRAIMTITNGVDEILLNALHVAPLSEMNQGFISAHAQKAGEPTKSRNAVDVELGFDGRNVVISVKDYFGTLDRSRLLAHMLKRYQRQEFRVGSRLSICGLGVSVMMKTRGSFSFCCDAHEQTTVTAVFRKTQDFREFRTQFRFLSTQFFF